MGRSATGPRLARDWYGDEFTHVAYRALGFAAVGGGLVMGWAALFGGSSPG